MTQALQLQKRAQYDSAIVLLDSSAAIFDRFNQTGNKFRALIRKAESLRSKNNFDKALEAIRIDRTGEEHLLKTDTHAATQRLVMIGSILRQQGKHDSSLTVARNALSIYQNLSLSDMMLQWDIYTLLAGTYFNFGNHDSAFAYCDRALQLFPSPNEEQQLKIGNTYNSIAGIYEARGDYQKTLDYFSRSLEIHRKLRGEHHPDVGRLYGNVAVAYFRLGDYDLSLEYYFKALAILNETLESGHTSIGVNYNNISMSYRSKGEFDKAVEYGERSKEIFVKKLGPKHANVAGVINNIGRTYSDMKQYDKGLEYYQSAFSIWKEVLGEKHPNVLQSYFNIGEAYGNMKQFAEAKRWLGQSLQLRRETLGEKNVKVAQAYNAIGTIYSEQGQYDSALYNFHHAVIALVESFDDSLIAATPSALKSPSDLDLLAALSGKARSLYLRGTKLKHSSDLRASLDSYEKAIQLTENIRRGFGSEGSKLQLSRMSFDVYERAIECAMKLSDMTKDVSFIPTAFALSERSKAGILSDAIAESDAKQFAGIPDTLLEQESKLLTDLTYIETQIQKEKEKRGKANASKIAVWENTLFDLHRKYENLAEIFEKNYPDFYSLKHQSNYITLKEVQESLPDNTTALLEYVVGDSSVTIFAITKKECLVKSRKIPSLTDQVKQFRLSVYNVESEKYASLAHALYAQLIAPVQSGLKGIQKVYVVPDGILNYLPFEALMTKNPGKGINFSTAPYLLNQYEINYQISARFLVEQNRRNSLSPLEGGLRGVMTQFVGFAPVFSDRPVHSKVIYAASSERVTRSRTIDGEEFAELKESESEVKGIYDLFNANKNRAMIFLHNNATESNLKSADISRSRFIHIATHGLINEAKPKLSGIIFAAPEGQSSDDGILYSGEVYNLKLNADLVVLSACETGLGTIVKGEGMLGLTRGFMYAGAKNILVSLWQVADKSTSELMVEFYRNILNKQSYSTALRNAKLAMIKKGKYAHPVEWSPFVLMGK
ncbi:MAG: CHAT domain-containing protein [Ignavibacteriales bacterium]|nr:CHAT domain-containing protein [Ignavibacteriales bacterium]